MIQKSVTWNVVEENTIADLAMLEDEATTTPDKDPDYLALVGKHSRQGKVDKLHTPVDYASNFKTNN